MFFGMNIQMALDLQLNRDSDTAIPEFQTLPIRHQREIRRRIWWLCYLADTFVSASNGKPRWIAEELLQVPLPASETIWLPGYYIDPKDEKEIEENQVGILSSKEIFCGGILFPDYISAHIVLVRVWICFDKFVDSDTRSPMFLSAQSGVFKRRIHS